MPKLRRRYQTALARERSPLRAHDRERAPAQFFGLKTSGQLDHLNIAAAASYDDATFVEGASESKGLDSLRKEHNRNNIAAQRRETRDPGAMIIG